MPSTLRNRDDLATKDRLVRVVLELSEDQPIDEIKVEEVLGASGISTGSLYHHFEDFGHLIETAMVERYLELLRSGELFIQSALDEAKDLEDVKARVAVVGGMYAKLNTPGARFERARILARAERSERLARILGRAQQDFTDSLTEMFERAQQEGGWINPALNPRAIAVFIQAYTFGRLVDDITPNPMSQDDWMDLVNAFFIGTVVSQRED